MSKVDFLTQFVSQVQLSNVILVSPSMSGSYSLPYVLTHAQNVAGYVPIAPTATGIVPPSKVRALQVYNTSSFKRCLFFHQSKCGVERTLSLNIAHLLNTGANNANIWREGYLIFGYQISSRFEDDSKFSGHRFEEGRSCGIYRPTRYLPFSIV